MDSTRPDPIPKTLQGAESPALEPFRKSVQYLKGVGPKRAEKLEKLGILTVWDLIHHFPRRHDDRTERVAIGRVQPGTTKTLQGTVEDFDVVRAGRHLSIGRAFLKDESGSIVASWFRHASPRWDVFAGLRKQLVKGATVLVHGPIERVRNECQMRVEEHELAGPGSLPIHVGRLVPIYDLTEGVDARWLRELVWSCLQSCGPLLSENLPADFMARHGLAPHATSVTSFHFPADRPTLEAARRRLAFEEFFFLEMALAAAREQKKQGPPAVKCQPTRRHLTPFREKLGFDFTPAQKHVINEIFTEMAGSHPMNRLLQGDVGSGKTVVALSAMLLAAENGLQSVLMAPTEILAEQHASTLEKFLKGLPLRWAILSGSRPKKQRQALLEQLATGELDIAVGTHALLEEDVRFKKLGLIVIDEQHRFGVDQRAKLQGKSPLAESRSAHSLVMTATPIPRTLAMTYYGDLSVSTIRQLPPGRPVLTTHWTLEANAMEAVRRATAAGQQAFIVFPLVDESDKLDLRAAIKEWERLSRLFAPLSVGLLHGRMKSAEKEEAMARFSRGETIILVATPVIEVGIDVPNATVMVIMHGERFGLAQLHQLRGRVGRGKDPSHCYLVSNAKSSEAVARLELLCRTRDGFVLAEEDLKLRGPGEFLGEAQHGVLPFKVGDLILDGDLIAEARDAAFRILEVDPTLAKTEHRLFKNELRQRFSHRLRFGQVA